MFSAGGTKYGLGILCVLLLFAGGLYAQNSIQAVSEAAALVGLRLDELTTRFGAPKTVYTSRGQETWQDDVVFVYDAGDFYIYKDRVWQVSLKNAGGITLGSSKPAVSILLDGSATDNGNHILQPLSSSAWPLMLRVNFNDEGRVRAIYIYRGDY